MNLRQNLNGTMNMTKKGKNKAAGVDLTIQSKASPTAWQMVYRCIFIVLT